MLLSDYNRAQELGMCSCCLMYKDDEFYIRNKELIDDDEFWEKEEAWFFYESGVQDMREIKNTIKYL